MPDPTPPTRPPEPTPPPMPSGPASPPTPPTPPPSSPSETTTAATATVAPPTGRIERLTAWSDRVTARGLRWLQGRLARVLWLVGASLLAVGGLGFHTVQAMSLVAHEERTEEVTVDAAGIGSLVVDNDAGGVDIVGVEGADTITVHARISEGLRSTGHDVDVRDGMLMVRGTCPAIWSDWCTIDYSIEVPSDLFVDVRALDAITLTDQAAGVQAHSSVGSIDMTRVGGDVSVSASQSRIEGRSLTADRVDADSAQGRIILGFSTSPDRVRAQADQGRIDIVVPDDSAVFYDIEIRTPQGSQSADVRDDPDSDRTIDAQANQGSVTIGYGAA